ncbi:hypothetical protein [Streptomyces sp. NPDC005438]|uniref:hypothetical protein n=1 Tax=Streptomyces sp. NPDC005438 TaxID=3156880 RepID=UPI00339FDFD0
MTDRGANLLTRAAKKHTSGGWTAGRITAVVVGGILSLVALTLVGLGGTALTMGLQDDGYINLGTDQYAHHTDTYAMSTESWRADKDFGGLYEDLRITFTPKDSSAPVFVGVAEKNGAHKYLDGVEHVTIHDSKPGGDVTSKHNGGKPSTNPDQADVWMVESAGKGAQTVDWTVKSGEVQAVAMKADGTPGLSGHVDVSAKIAGLAWMGVALLVVGLLLLAVSVIWLIRKPIRLARGTA